MTAASPFIMMIFNYCPCSQATGSLVTSESVVTVVLLLVVIMTLNPIGTRKRTEARIDEILSRLQSRTWGQIAPLRLSSAAPFSKSDSD